MVGFDKDFYTEENAHNHTAAEPAAPSTTATFRPMHTSAFELNNPKSTKSYFEKNVQQE
jgi:hypothetical protein